MEDILQRAFSIIIAVVIFFLLPLYIAFEKKDDISYSMALRITSNFVDNVANKGYISKEMYLDYVTNLAFTNNTYDVTILHTAKKYYPTIYAKVKNGSNTTTKEYDYAKYSDNYKDYIQGNETTINSVNYKQGTNNTLDLNYKLEEIQHTDKEMLANCEGDINTVGRTYSIDDHFVYPMSKGDEFTVVIKNTNTTIASILFNTLTMGINDGNDTKVYINYGGTIQNESYRKNAIIGESTNVVDTETEVEEKLNNLEVSSDIVMKKDHPVGTAYGDVNGDGEVNIVDIALINRKIANIDVSNFNEYAADVNFDGNINDKDKIRISEIDAGFHNGIVLNTDKNEINFYLKVNNKLGTGNVEKINDKLSVVNGSVENITFVGNVDGYYTYKILVKVNSEGSNVILTVNEGLEASNGTLYPAMSKTVSLASNSDTTTLGCTVTADKTGDTITPSEVVTYTIKFDREVTGLTLEKLNYKGSPYDGGLKGSGDTYTLKLICTGGNVKQWVQVNANSCIDSYGNFNSESNKVEFTSQL